MKMKVKHEKIKYMKTLVELICLKNKVQYISDKYVLEKSTIHNLKYLNMFFIPK